MQPSPPPNPPAERARRRKRLVPVRLGIAVAVLLTLLVCLLAIVLWGASPFTRQRPPPAIALFTSLPILWRESDDMAELLAPHVEPHWALAALSGKAGAGKAGPRPLDTLSPAPRGIDLVVMAQPRPLSPQENVALDDWVRGGGRVLLFADPLLTRDSAFSLGDKRRPQDVVLLSPILARWGLRLEFDAAQPAGQRETVVLDQQIPVNLPGRFAIEGKGGACTILADGLAARCRAGRGSVLALADAALLDNGTPQDRAARREALAGLIAAAGE